MAETQSPSLSSFIPRKRKHSTEYLPLLGDNASANYLPRSGLRPFQGVHSSPDPTTSSPLTIRITPTWKDNTKSVANTSSIK
jgi:hypothetical protein